MIEIKKMTKKFKERTLFNQFDLVITQGEFVVFSGPSGSGKTTLLNIIGGIEPIDGGEVLVNKKNIHHRKNQLAYFRYDVGFLFQNFALVENKTVCENLSFIRKDARNDVSIAEALSIVGLEDKINAKVYTLSGGEQQRIALARLLIKKSHIILADEPTGSLDKENAAIVISLLRKLHQDGKTVILVTHDEDMKNIAERKLQL